MSLEIPLSAGRVVTSVALEDKVFVSLTPMLPQRLVVPILFSAVSASEALVLVPFVIAELPSLQEASSAFSAREGSERWIEST
jgi:hypothetical protein